MGSARRFSSLVTRSLMTNKIHNTAEITSSEIDVAECQEKEFPASKRTVTNRRVAPKREIVPQ